MSDIDWSKAPKGATHWEPDGYSVAGWMMLSGGEWYYWPTQQSSKQEWVGSYPRARRVATFIARPTKPQWNGEGLPPVGVVIEWKEKTEFQWVAAEVLFVSDKSIVLRRFDGFEWQSMPCRLAFRPIRTPEQIAAEEREAAISEMTQFFMNYYGNPKAAEQYFIICRSLHDAGYRKQEQAK